LALDEVCAFVSLMSQELPGFAAGRGGKQYSGRHTQGQTQKEIGESPLFFVHLSSCQP
jgi:hypothetical protein